MIKLNEIFLEKLVKKYSHNIDLNGFEDISAAISDSYQLNFEYDGTNIDGLVGRTKVHLKEDFSSAKLFKLLSKKFGILSSSFTKEESVKEILRHEIKAIDTVTEDSAMGWHDYGVLSNFFMKQYGEHWDNE